MTTLAAIRNEVKQLPLAGVIGWLEDLASSEDPIFYKGEETTPVQLEYKLGWETDPSKIRISFYGDKRGGGFGLRKNSTFAQMIYDRQKMEAQRKREEKRQSRRPVVEYKVTWKTWEGIEPCGSTEWSTHARKFTNRNEAKRFFKEIKRSADHVKFTKTTTEPLGESDD